MEKGGKKQDIEKRAFDFSVRTVKMVLHLPQNSASWKIGGQVIASATSIHSNIIHAKAGISKKDFVNHQRISLKEAKETKGWLEMIVATGLCKPERMKLLLAECEELICILVACVKNSSKNL
jgi:four helix bundle protein